MGERDDILHDIWPVERERLQKQLIDEEKELIEKGKYTTALYNVQMYTNLLFDYAYQHRDFDILEQLAELYMIPLDFLEEVGQYWFYKGGLPCFVLLPLEAPSRMWLNKRGIKKDEESEEKIPIQFEMILHSSQFLYLLSHAIHCFVSIPVSERRNRMQAFIDQYTPVVEDHYKRWVLADNGSTGLSDSVGVFQTKDWGCSNGRFNHKQFLEKKLNREFGDLDPNPRCNVLLDSDMWIFSGAVELLAAQKKDPGLFSMTAEQEKGYLDYFSVACRLLEDRLVETSLKDFDGADAVGYNFDPGTRRLYDDMRYAGYTGSVFPEDNSEDKENPRIIIDPADHPVPDNISIDTGHGRRFVQVFETLYRNRSITQQVFPSKEVLKRLANQVAYRIFNGDSREPLFSNYFDGSNGWYRVNYSKRDRFGFAPWDMSLNWIECGFGAWKKYQPAIKEVTDAVWNMIKSTDDPDIEKFKFDHYVEDHYSNGERYCRKEPFDLKSSHFILNFIAACDLPEFPELSINRTGLNFGAMEGSEKTYSQQVTVTNTGAKTLTWTAQGDSEWLKCSPETGINAGLLTVSVEPRDLPAGTYEGKVTVADPDAENSPQTIAVSLKVYQSSQDIRPIGEFEKPADGEIVSGSVPVSGWALDEIGIENVKVYRKALPEEGKGLLHIGDAVFVEDARPDAAQAHPDFPANYRAGWGYMLLTNVLPNGGNGTFKLHVKARNTLGQKKTLGVKTIHCDNATAVRPFGTIDIPAPGGMMSGSHSLIQGWVLTPQPNKIPEDGSTIKVYVDNHFIGHAKYNKPRPDIEKLFPGYANSKGALAYFDLDTTTFGNGVHTLAWSVTDNAGNAAGIGSRFFVIQN